MRLFLLNDINYTEKSDRHTDSQVPSHLGSLIPFFVSTYLTLGHFSEAYKRPASLPSIQVLPLTFDSLTQGFDRQTEGVEELSLASSIMFSNS